MQDISRQLSHRGDYMPRPPPHVAPTPVAKSVVYPTAHTALVHRMWYDTTLPFGELPEEFLDPLASGRHF